MSLQVTLAVFFCLGHLGLSLPLPQESGPTSSIHQGQAFLVEPRQGNPITNYFEFIPAGTNTVLSQPVVSSTVQGFGTANSRVAGLATSETGIAIAAPTAFSLAGSNGVANSYAEGIAIGGKTIQTLPLLQNLLQNFGDPSPAEVSPSTDTGSTDYEFPSDIMKDGDEENEERAQETRVSRRTYPVANPQFRRRISRRSLLSEPRRDNREAREIPASKTNEYRNSNDVNSLLAPLSLHLNPTSFANNCSPLDFICLQMLQYRQQHMFGQSYYPSYNYYTRGFPFMYPTMFPPMTFSPMHPAMYPRMNFSVNKKWM